MPDPDLRLPGFLDAYTIGNNTGRRTSGVALAAATDDGFRRGVAHGHRMAQAEAAKASYNEGWNDGYEQGQRDAAMGLRESPLARLGRTPPRA